MTTAKFQDLNPQFMTPEAKLRAAEDLRWAAWRLKEAWLRDLHPDWSDSRVTEAVREIFLHART
ncbi:MAG: hypothetical protein A2170_17905 [Deltaproteobacteria bacterium RBG_13_53_10]|nr:MAG: hypothetical protein A2170_17905 [Deltaproteobacteria bacterium RBG_13_53_10]